MFLRVVGLSMLFKYLGLFLPKFVLGLAYFYQHRAQNLSVWEIIRFQGIAVTSYLNCDATLKFEVFMHLPTHIQKHCKPRGISDGKFRNGTRNGESSVSKQSVLTLIVAPSYRCPT